MAEGTKDSIFRVPQRVKNALRILATASMLAGCTPEPTQPPIGATDIPGSTNPAMTLTVEPPTQTEIPTAIATAAPTEIPTPAGYKPISEMTSESECSQNIIRTDHVQEDIGRMIKQIEQNQEHNPAIYLDGWSPDNGLPYPYFGIRLNEGNSPPQIVFCGTSPDGNITYVAIDKFPIARRQGTDVQYEYVPAVFALDEKTFQRRYREMYGDEPYFTAHMSLKALFEPNTGIVSIAIMGDRDNTGIVQSSVDYFEYNAAYITLIKHLIENNDYTNRFQRILTGAATEEEIQWWKDFLQKNPIPATIAVDIE